MNKETHRLSVEESKLLTSVMTMGTGTALPVVISPCELARLIGVIYHDNDAGVKLEAIYPQLWSKINPGIDYYEIQEDWFLQDISLEPEQHVALMRIGGKQIDDFSIYLHCLSELHKRRRKYSMILSSQPIPELVQISPRSLIEYGCIDPRALASWLTWKKLFYDLDNRSAQEAGYLFEPILAAAIGGEPKNARAKVVTRSEDATKGRQVDCWKILPDGRKLAYEFKLRVTIAASGQGRFKEEIQFAADASHSDAIPILLVLDPTASSRLDELRKAYIENGGQVYLGEEAWKHLASAAGSAMSKFIEKYVRPPIEKMDILAKNGIDLLDFHAAYKNGKIEIQLGDHVRKIQRR